MKTNFLLLLLAVLPGVLTAQADISCLDNLNTVGSAGLPVIANECMTLTNNTSQASAAWTLTQVDLTESFSLDFDFTVVGGVDPFGGGFADGFVFVLQTNDSNQLGAQGGSLGYDGIGNSLGLEFDWFTADGMDIGINGSHIALMNNGTTHPANELAFFDLPGNNIINDSPSSTYSANVLYEWDASALTLEVYLDGVMIISFGDITTVLPSTDVWAGFVGATGGNSAIQTVCLNDIAVADTELEGTQTSGTLLTVNLDDALDATSPNNNLATSISNGAGNVAVSYFESLTDLMTGTNAIANPASYENAQGTVVYALVENVFGCSQIAEITIEGTVIVQPDVPTVSQWGLLCLAILLMSTLTIAIGARISEPTFEQA